MTTAIMVLEFNEEDFDINDPLFRSVGFAYDQNFNKENWFIMASTLFIKVFDKKVSVASICREIDDILNDCGLYKTQFHLVMCEEVKFNEIEADCRFRL